MSSKKRKRRRADYEAELAPGLERFVEAELSGQLGERVRDIRRERPGFLRFRCDVAPREMDDLRSVVALYRIHHFAIPRPKALLGHQHFARLVEILRGVAAEMPTFPSTFGLGAAGWDSRVMRRLRAEIGAALALDAAEDGKGQLFARLARNRSGGGWELLARTGAAPLSKRAYRLADVPGALNATVAYAMTRAAEPAPGRAIVNLCSGSGTILIELARTGAAGKLIAVDNDAAMLAAGRLNAEASGFGKRIEHIRADATATPLPAGSARLLYADLPFGHLIGSRAGNLALYPAVLREASRLAAADARFVLLTHEISLLKGSLRGSGWTLLSEDRLILSGLHPRLFVLAPKTNRIE